MVAMKSRISLLILALVLVFTLTACGPKSSGSIVEGKVNVVTTFILFMSLLRKLVEMI